MELLRIKHHDFVMTIECTKFDAIWDKAKRNVGEDKLSSTYSWSDGVELVERYLNDQSTSKVILKDSSAPAIFFDNADYPIWVEFEEKNDAKIVEAHFGSILQNDNDRFSFRHGMLAGFLNFGNEIGRSEICFDYIVKRKKSDGVSSELIKRKFSFSFEVLSTKLDYHSHWKKIVEDIEQEYRMLSLDFLKRTYHSFAPDKQGETPEIIWWSIFAG